jgi:multidrug efflux pump subunit AcrA (membrane-fusion protein)
MEIHVVLKRKKRFGAAAFCLCLAAVHLSGCERIKDAYARLLNGPDGGVSQETPVFAVNTSTAVKGQIRDYIALSGDIIAGSTVDTYSDAAGKVTRLYVAVGDWVRKDDPVADVDPSKPGLNYVPSVVKAPITGTVVNLPAQLGMTVTQAVPLARIAGGTAGRSAGALEIRLYVAERFISKMAMNLPCEISLDAWPGEVFRGTIREIAPTVDPASRTMEIRVNVDNPGSKLKAGMFAKVRVITEEKQGIVKIPASAMIQRFGENYVFSVEADPADPANHVARRKSVVPGILIDGILEILEGLSPDEEIVVRGQTLLEDNARINIIERVAPLSAN